MQTDEHAAAVSALQQTAHLVTGASNDYDLLLDLVGDARYVLLGTSSYGTHEFWAARARITRRLIDEKAFNAVAVDADWSDGRHVNRYVTGIGGAGDARAALDEFQPFPAWVWRNSAIFDFVDWLKQHNAARQSTEPAIGFYGLDLYDSNRSIASVLRFLDRVHPGIARRARDYFARADYFGLRGAGGAELLDRDWSSPLHEELVDHLLKSRSAALNIVCDDNEADGDLEFYATQSALLAPNVDRYYRTMLGECLAWWNLRNRHLAERVDDLAEQLIQSAGSAKVVVWAHQRLVGDARATDLGRHGLLSAGQVMRGRHGRDVVLIGFSTFSGTVTAATEWDAPGEAKRLDAALPESVEAIFHETGHPRFFLPLRSSDTAACFVAEERPERSIGVVYDPDDPRFAEPYVKARLADQFDAVIHFDQTTAVQPLDFHENAEAADLPESISATV